MVKYCNKTCQISHFPDHKVDCLEFNLFLNIVKAGIIVDCPPVIAPDRVKQDYFAYERMVEVFTAKCFAKDFLALSVLAVSYLVLGQDDKAAAALKTFEEIDVYRWNLDEQTCLKLGLKLNEIEKTRENPPDKAVQEFEAFRNILLKSCEETHLKLAASSPVMVTIQKHINMNYIQELQDECVSQMIYGFKNHREAYVAFSCIADDLSKEELQNVLQKESENCNLIYFFGKNYFPRHPEFPHVYQKYKEMYAFVITNGIL